MKILLVNKFLHPKGGSETYLLQLGACLEGLGHEVQYFGMDSPERTVGNRVNAYTRPMDFHTATLRQKLGYGLRVIYSREARRQIRRVLEDFRPDVCHLNNFNYQLTPAILLEIRKWEQESGHPCRILYTAHDYQLVCPNHLCRNPATGENCERCLEGSFLPCIRGRCIHGSLVRSLLGAAEGAFWKRKQVYRQLDSIICCSRFLKARLDRNPVLREKTRVLSNFVAAGQPEQAEKQDYVLYVGRYTEEKGVEDLLHTAASLPQISFRFAGAGPLAEAIERLPNADNLGFLSGEELRRQIQGARFMVCPSRWQENCPLSVLESIALGTPVLGARIGGIPELIRPGLTGMLFESGDPQDLREKLLALWQDTQTQNRMARCCREAKLDIPEDYAGKLLKLMGEESADGTHRMDR